jgi:hypothetical protein
VPFPPEDQLPGDCAPYGSVPDDAVAESCIPYPCPPVVAVSDWPDGGGVLLIPSELREFDAGAWCVGHQHGPGAEAVAEHLWLHWCAQVNGSLVCAYYHDPMGFFVAVVRAADGRMLKHARIRQPRGVEWPDSVDRTRTWARATAIAAADELRCGSVDPPGAAHDDRWLRSQLDRLGRREP